MRRAAAVALLLLGAGAAEAQCLSTPQASRRSLEIGQNWVRSSCRGGIDADCVDVINSVIRSISDLEGCPGFAPGEVNGIVAQLRAMAGRGGPAAQQEAEDRYQQRMAPPPPRSYSPPPPVPAPGNPNPFGLYGQQPGYAPCTRYSLNADGSKYCY